MVPQGPAAAARAQQPQHQQIAEAMRAPMHAHAGAAPAPAQTYPAAEFQHQLPAALPPAALSHSPFAIGAPPFHLTASSAPRADQVKLDKVDGVYNDTGRLTPAFATTPRTGDIGYATCTRYAEMSAV